jgi:hypothetical protein
VHASCDRECLVYLNEKAIQELKVRNRLSFLDAGENFWKANQKTGKAWVLRCLLGVGAAMPTSVVSSHKIFSILGYIISHAAISNKVEISTQADDLPNHVNLDISSQYGYLNNIFLAVPEHLLKAPLNRFPVLRRSHFEIASILD